MIAFFIFISAISYAIAAENITVGIIGIIFYILYFCFDFDNEKYR